MVGSEKLTRTKKEKPTLVARTWDF